MIYSYNADNCFNVRSDDKYVALRKKLYFQTILFLCSLLCTFNEVYVQQSQPSAQQVSN